MDNFGVKYFGKKNSDHLIAALKGKYKISEDCTGSLYCGIGMDWNYIARTLDFGMPGYIKKQLQSYKHSKPTCPHHSPHPVGPRQYGKSSQDPIPPDDTTAGVPDSILQIQHVVWSILYYARAVDLTALKVLTTLRSDQAKATTHTMKRTEHLLDYLATHPNAKMRYYASSMVLNIHSYASYASKRGVISRALGHYFLG